MNIKPMIYDTLTARQRVIATIEAIARGDDTECDKLVDTCPKKRYLQPDYQYSGTVQGLITMVIAIEYELTVNVMSLLLSVNMKKLELGEIFAQKIINLHTAWNQHLEAMGIDPQTMDKLVKDLRHPAVEAYLKTDLQEALTADEEAVKKQLTDLNSFFKRFCA